MKRYDINFVITKTEDGLKAKTDLVDSPVGIVILHCDHLAAIAEKDRRIAELEAERRWIPVTERLPEDGQEVLACDSDLYVIETRTYWTDKPVDYDFWMAMPSPPKGEPK